LLRKHRNGLIKPEHTPKAYEQGLVGGETACQGERVKARNDIHNPINGPINNLIANANRKVRNIEAAEASLRENFPDQIEAPVTLKEADAHGQRILDTKYPDLGDLSILDFLIKNPEA